MDLTQFRLQYPEFRTCLDPFVQEYLDRAATMLDQSVCGTRYDLLHGLKAAHLLALSPAGINVRLLAKDGTTTYQRAFQEVLLSKISGVMVV